MIKIPEVAADIIKETDTMSKRQKLFPIVEKQINAFQAYTKRWDDAFLFENQTTKNLQ